MTDDHTTHHVITLTDAAFPETITAECQHHTVFPPIIAILVIAPKLGAKAHKPKLLLVAMTTTLVTAGTLHAMLTGRLTDAPRSALALMTGASATAASAQLGKTAAVILPEHQHLMLNLHFKGKKEERSEILR